MASSDLGGVAGWVVDIIDSIGEVGVGALIALENVLPPIPSEVILPLAGFSASQGNLNPLLAWVAATIGALLGAYILYAVRALVGHDRVHELASKRWFVLFSQSDLARGERFFNDHGAKVVLLGRCVPLVRSVVSLPAGVARMPLWRFAALPSIGSGVGNALFIYAGYRLGNNWTQVQQYLQPVSYVVTGALVPTAQRPTRSAGVDRGRPGPREAGSSCGGSSASIASPRSGRYARFCQHTEAEAFRSRSTSAVRWPPGTRPVGVPAGIARGPLARAVVDDIAGSTGS